MKHITASGVPQKVDRSYLKSVGFKGGNDGYLVSILKWIGFLDHSGVPQASWRSYKDTKRGPKILADAVRSAYGELFEIYPDAHRKDEEAIRNWVRTRTDYDEVKVGHAVATFKNLCSLADFDAAETEGHSPTPSISISSPTPITSPGSAPSAPGNSDGPTNGGDAVRPSININIELHLPPSTDAVTYDRFFESMKKHLFSDGSPTS